MSTFQILIEGLDGDEVEHIFDIFRQYKLELMTRKIELMPKEENKGHIEWIDSHIEWHESIQKKLKVSKIY